jgi:carbamoyltransferase
MKIVGTFNGGHDHSWSLIENNNIVACYSEERFSRIKSCYSKYAFPIFSLDALQKDFDIDIMSDKIELVAAKPINVNTPEIINILNHRSIKLYGHHFSHACGAYYTSGFDENTLIASIDGGDAGDDIFTEINKDNVNKYSIWKNTHNFGIFYTVRDGKIVEIDKNLRLKHGSVANLWMITCNAFDLLENKDEGKIMGLAAQGKFDQKIYNWFNFFIKNDCYITYNTTYKYFRDLLKNLSPEKQLDLKRKIAYNLQYVTEEHTLKLLNDINNKYGPFKNICLTGGLFANVKLNQKINEYLSFSNVWVYPAMSDEGLSLGSAIAHGVELEIFKNRRIDNVFFGKKYTDIETNKFILDFPKNYRKNIYVQKLDYNIIGDLLVKGKVIGLYDGSSEYGPRALGNRSIMVEPTKKETHEYINMRLKRDEIMPFAPIILEEYINDVCHYYKSKYTSEFMTMCYNVKDNWIKKIPAVINVYDGTARPQVVNKKHTHFYNILTKFYEKTGIPVLMNTSFNGHGEPIINSPKDALDHLSNGTIDYLIINNKICNI